MTALALATAAALVFIGVVAAAGTVVPRVRATAAVATGGALLLVADSATLAASPTARSVALAAAPLVLAFAAVTIAGPRFETVAACVGALAAGPLRQLLDDPFHDARCRVYCDVNPLVVAPHPAVADFAHRAGDVAIAVALIALVVRSSRGGHRLAFVALALAAVPFLASSGTQWVWLPAAVAVTVLAVDLVSATTLTARLATGVEALAFTADPEIVLGSVLDDDRLSVAYPIDGSPRLVDRDGLPVRPAAPGSVVVDVTGPGGLVAQVRATVTTTSASALTRVLRGPLRLALENTRLAAEAAVRAREVSASARRIVERADDSRRTFERDLHDGAQRHVLTLGLALQAEPGLDHEVRARAEATVRSVLDQLRGVAHGIHAAELDTRGLAHALAGLAHRSPVPLAVEHVPEASGTDPRVVAVYLLVEEVVGRSSGPVTASVHNEGTAWSVLVQATGDNAPSTRAADRFVALGGSLETTLLGPELRYAGVLPS